jgi:hypothetical protein
LSDAVDVLEADSERCSWVGGFSVEVVPLPQVQLFVESPWSSHVRCRYRECW